MLIGVFVTAILARYFGPEQFGTFNYALSFVMLFTAISTLGLETLTVKSIVEKDYNEGTILCTSLVLRVLGGIVLTILATSIIRILEPSDGNIHLLVLIMSSMMVIKSLEVIEYWIQAYQRAKISSIVRIVSNLVSSGLKVILALTGGSLIQLSLIYMIDAIIIGTGLIICYLKIREDKSKWQFKFYYAKSILSKSWYLILSGLMITLYMRVDQVMLGYMLSNKSEVGVYSAAVSIASMWYFVPLALITSFKPVIMSKKRENEESYLKLVQLLYIIVAWMGIGFGVLILPFSKIIVSILFGSDYLEAASILSISIWAGTFAMLGSARSIWLLCEGKQKYTLVYTSLGFIVNLVLNYLLIPQLGGHGAAVATLSAQFSANVLGLAFFKETRVSTIMILKALSPKELFRAIKFHNRKL